VRLAHRRPSQHAPNPGPESDVDRPPHPGGGTPRKLRSAHPRYGSRSAPACVGSRPSAAAAEGAEVIAPYGWSRIRGAARPAAANDCKWWLGRESKQPRNPLRIDAGRCGAEFGTPDEYPHFPTRSSAAQVDVRMWPSGRTRMRARRKGTFGRRGSFRASVWLCTRRRNCARHGSSGVREKGRRDDSPVLTTAGTASSIDAALLPSARRVLNWPRRGITSRPFATSRTRSDAADRWRPRAAPRASAGLPRCRPRRTRQSGFP
jgi:hypothetical protein